MSKNQSNVGMEDAEFQKKGLLQESVQLKKLWPYFGKDKKWIIFSAILVPLIALQSSLPAVVMKHVIDNGVLAGNKDVILWSSVFYLAIRVADYLAQTSQSFAAGYAVQGMATRLRNKLVHHVLTRPLRFHDRNMSGALVTRATSDFENLSQSLNQGILTSVADLAKLLGSFAGLFYLGWYFGVFAIVAVLIGSFVVNWFSVRLRTAMMESRKHSSKLNAFAQEILSNSSTVKHISGEKAAADKFDRFNEKNRASQMKEVVHDANLFSFLDGISAIFIGLGLYFVLKLSGLEEAKALGVSVTAGTLVAFVQYMFQLFEPLKQLGNKIAMLQGVFTAIERIFGILEVKEEIKGTDAVGSIDGVVKVQDLNFQYNKEENSPHILKDVSFCLNPGDSLAIVGRTGSGKSTIIRILTKLYDGYDGSIQLDGCELSNLDPLALRKHISVVSQDVALFNASIRFNVSLGLKDVTDEMVLKACKLAGADRFINKLPEGLDYTVSEKGENLSQGQRQLLSLARALVHEPRVLILDEATSSVDPQSEQIFQSAVERILGQCTVIVVAHRLETISKCRFVMVLDAGKVQEFGGYQELLDQKGPFWRLKDELAQGAEEALPDAD